MTDTAILEPPVTTAGEIVHLRDGTEVLRRPITPEDRERLQEFHARVSPASVYRRYLAPKATLSPADLTYLTEVDHRRHEALVVADPASGDLIGVGRFVELPPAAGVRTAEVAFLVTDAWQGRGAGALLLAGLITRARTAGLDRLEAWVMPDNRLMLEVFAHSGLPRHERLEDALVHVTMELSGPGS